MAHFYAEIQGNKGHVSRLGSKTSGIVATAASWQGSIKVHLYVDEQGRDCYNIYQDTWKGEGVYKPIASGVIGE